MASFKDPLAELEALVMAGNKNPPPISDLPDAWVTDLLRRAVAEEEGTDSPHLSNDGTHDLQPDNPTEGAELRKLRGELNRALQDRSIHLVDLWVG